MFLLRQKQGPNENIYRHVNIMLSNSIFINYVKSNPYHIFGLINTCKSTPLS